MYENVMYRLFQTFLTNIKTEENISIYWLLILSFRFLHISDGASRKCKSLALGAQETGSCLPVRIKSIMAILKNINELGVTVLHF